MKSKTLKIMATLTAVLMASIVVMAEPGLITTGTIQTKAKQDVVTGGAKLTTPEKRTTMDVDTILYRFDGNLITNSIINFYASDLGVDTLLYSKSNSTMNAAERITNIVINTTSIKVEVKTVETNFPYKVHWGVIGK